MPELNEPGLNAPGLDEPGLDEPGLNEDDEPNDRSGPPARAGDALRDVLRDVAWVVGTFVLLGVVGGVLWWLLAEPPYFVRTDTTAVMGQAELGKRIPVDGIFVSIGALGSAVLGFALMAWRRRDPLLVLLAGVVASVLAGFVALKLGEHLGHRDVQALVEQAKLGAKVRDTLDVITGWVLLAWPVGFLVAAVSSLLGSSKDGSRR